MSWTLKSSTNLESIHDYIASDSGSAFYAKRFVRALIQATRKLETFPRCGREVPELRSFGFREVIHKGYRIVYRIAVVLGARDLLRFFREDWDV